MPPHLRSDLCGVYGFGFTGEYFLATAFGNIEPSRRDFHIAIDALDDPRRKCRTLFDW